MIKLILFIAVASLFSSPQPIQAPSEIEQGFLSAPFLQDPTETTIKVVWFTDFEGTDHYVAFSQRIAKAETRILSRMRVNHSDCVGCQPVDVWRHEAVLENLTPGSRIEYRVCSIQEGQSIWSDAYTCAAAPPKGMGLKILLTSDHQNKPMVAANMQKVVEAAGKVDAVFFAGDMVNIPDDYSLWFRSNNGGSFFSCMQGFANQCNGQAQYQGGKILQHAPIFTAAGNHEIMGIYSNEQTLEYQFQHPRPRHIAEQLDDSFNQISYDEIFNADKYYAVTFGDIRLVVLHATRIWRRPTMEEKWGATPCSGKYEEAPEDVDDISKWGGGDFIFEPIDPASRQYKWLVQELESEEFKQAKYKVVMLHHPLHSLGENAIPPFTDPVQTVTVDAGGKITAVRYEYPKENDYLIRDIEPLLEKHGVNLVLFGHSHVWNRFISPSGMHYLETSNVGNSYGAYLTHERALGPLIPDENYSLTGDPNGLKPIVPSIAPLHDADGKPLPFIASNTITVFSLLDTSTGTVDSYYFDTEHPDRGTVKFDSFSL